jgi:hypothetical protein
MNSSSKWGEWGGGESGETECTLAFARKPQSQLESKDGLITLLPRLYRLTNYMSIPSCEGKSAQTQRLSPVLPARRRNRQRQQIAQYATARDMTMTPSETTCDTIELRQDLKMTHGLRSTVDILIPLERNKIEPSPSRNGGAPNPDANHAWPAGEDNDPRDTQRRSATLGRTRLRTESAWCPLHRLARLGIAYGSDTRPNGPPSPTALPQMPSAARLSSVAGLVAQISPSVWNSRRSAHPPTTARHMTAHYDRLAAPYGHETPALGAMYPTVSPECLGADGTDERLRAVVNARHDHGMVHATACRPDFTKPTALQRVSLLSAKTVDVKHSVPQRVRELAVAAHRRPHRPGLHLRCVCPATHRPCQCVSDLQRLGWVVEIGKQAVAERCSATHLFADRCGSPFSARLLATGRRS